MVDQVGLAPPERLRPADCIVPGLMAALAFLLQAIALGNYGYFRDELYYIACSNRLAWGYVDHPPLSIALLALTRALLGDGLWAIRLPALLALSGAVFSTGLIARSLGGGRFAQAVAGVALIANPTIMGSSSFYSMNALDLLFWAALALILSETLRTGKANGWLLFGLVAGLGLLNKYSVAFLGGTLVVALLLTRYRRHFLYWQLWLGGFIAGALFVPHLLWQLRNGFPTLEFMYNASHFKNTDLPPHLYLLTQVLEMGPFNAILWGGGIIWACWPRRVTTEATATPDARPRLLASIFLLLLAFYAFSTGAKPYYMATAYTFMLPVGAYALEALSRPRPWLVRIPAVGLLSLGAAVTLPIALPLLPPEASIRYITTIGIAPAPAEDSHDNPMPQHLADRFGWPEMAAEMTRAYKALPQDEQQDCVIVVMNYGAAAALEFFGDKETLPHILCGHNNYFLWRPRDIDPDVALVLTFDEEALRQSFREVEQVGMVTHPYAMPYENQKPIYRCKGLLAPMEDVWENLREFI